MPKPANTGKKPVGTQPVNPEKLIIDQAIVDNQWQLLQIANDESEYSADSLPAGKLILPYSVWLSLREALNSRKQEIGVWLDSDETADLIGEHAAELPVIGINFSAFADGRGFTAARLLRQRYGFSGELRAVGGFIRDQLSYLTRCGFNAFAFEGDQPLSGLLESMSDFTDSYQAAVDQELPIFRRRALS